MTQRDGMGREEGGGFRMGNTCIPVVDSFWYMAKAIQYCKVKKKKKKKLMESSWWERLTEGETGSYGLGYVSNTLMQFSVDGQGCVPSLLFDLRPNCGGGSEDNGSLLQKVPCTHCCTECPNPAPGHHCPTPLPETPRHSRASVGQSLMGSLLLSPGFSCAQEFVCAL